MKKKRKSNKRRLHPLQLTGASNREKRTLDTVIYSVGIIFPLTTIPQIIEIWQHQSAVDVSLITWSSYWALSFIYLLWAIADRIKPLIISYALWQLVYVGMFYSILRFN